MNHNYASSCVLLVGGTFMNRIGSCNLKAAFG